MKHKKTHESFLRLKNDLAKMTWKDRIDHIWTYYKEGILIGLLFTVIAVGVLSSMLSKPKELLMGGALVNVPITDACLQYIDSDYLSALGGDPQTQQVNILLTHIYSPEDTVHLETSYQALMQTMAMIDSQALDYLIMDSGAMEIYLAQKVFLDLNTVFTLSELQEISDLLIYASVAEDIGTAADAQVPVAIKINDLPFVQAFMEDDSPLYIGFVSNGTNKAQYRAFLEYLLAWEAGLENQAARSVG